MRPKGVHKLTTLPASRSGSLNHAFDVVIWRIAVPSTTTSPRRARLIHLIQLITLIFCLLPAAPAIAQTPSQAVTGPSLASQVPLSGRSAQPGSVSVTQQTTNAGGGGSVNAIDSSVTVQGSYSGSTPNGTATAGILSLTLNEALARALRFNLGAISQTASVMQAQGQRQVARSSLLPNVNAAISEEFERLNLRTMGVESNTFPLTATFNFFDARAARLNQSVFDLVRIENLHSASENLKVNIKAAQNARDLVVLAVSGAYLQIVATNARIAASTAQVETAQAIYVQAADRFTAGLNARIDATRSQVQLQTEQQRLRSLQADLETQKLRLARIIGLPAGQRFIVTDEYRYSPLTELTQETAMQKAFQTRPDLESAAAGVKAAEAAVKAARAERIPNLAVTADFGAAGLRPNASSSGVYTVAGTMTIPLYEGGRIHGDIEQATAALRQRKAELDDLRGQIDQDVRQAFIDLNAAADQVGVARSSVGLAQDTLSQSRDRFAAGVADTVELVQAQQAVVQADDDLISAEFEHNLAKVSLARAVGNAEQTLPTLLRK
jgi:outer membrane protein TolC